MGMIGYFRRVPESALADLRTNPTALLSDRAEPTDDLLEVGKDWHGLHFALTGAEGGGDLPLSFVLHGGETLGDEDVGYGPARAFSPSEVKEISLALTPLTSEKLAVRCNAQRMDELKIYPGGWTQEPRSIDALLSTYEELRSFVADTATRGEALVVFVA